MANRKSAFKKLEYFKVFMVMMILFIPAMNLRAQWKPAENPLNTKWTSQVTPENVWPEYPRPTLVRQKWLNLNGLWDYAIRPKEEEMPAQYDGEILVPFSVESALSGVKNRWDPITNFGTGNLSKFLRTGQNPGLF